MFYSVSFITVYILSNLLVAINTFVFFFLGLTILFLLTHGPFHIWEMVHVSVPLYKRVPQDTLLLDDILLMVGFLNYAIKFLLYLLTDQNFRREVINICKRQNQVASLHELAIVEALPDVVEPVVEANDSVMSELNIASNIMESQATPPTSSY